MMNDEEILARRIRERAELWAPTTLSTMHALAYSSPLIVRAVYNRELHTFDVVIEKVRFWHFRKRARLKETLNTLEERLPGGILLRTVDKDEYTMDAFMGCMKRMSQ